MIRSSVDLPAPLAPSTPILAPWKNESQMPRRISRLGGITFLRSFITNAYSPAIFSEREVPPSRPPYQSITGVGRSRALGNEASVLGHHAAILHDPDPGPRELLGGRVVPDAELEPDRLRPPRQGQDLVGMTRQELGTAEDLDHVRRLGEAPQSRHGRRVVKALARELGIDGPDPIAAREQVRGNVVSGLRRAGLGAEHGHGLGLAKDLGEAGIIVDEQGAPVVHGASPSHGTASAATISAPKVSARQRRTPSSDASAPGSRGAATATVVISRLGRSSPGSSPNRGAASVRH